MKRLFRQTAIALIAASAFALSGCNVISNLIGLDPAAATDTPTGINQYPSAVVLASSYSVAVNSPSPAMLTGEYSTDPNGDALSYAWSVSPFCMVMPNPDMNAQMAFFPPSAGTYTVTLTVTDGRGGSSTATASISAY